MSQSQSNSSRPPIAAVEGECNLIVAGLTREIDDDLLHAMFSPFGTVLSSTVMRHVGTGVSRGFGFVLFAKREDGDAAIAAMHGSRCGPNTLNVHRSVHNGTIIETNAVFMRNLPLDVTASRIEDFFVASLGAVPRSISIAPDTSKDAGDAPNGRRYRVATVTFADVDTARAAVRRCHNTPFPLSVTDADEQPPLLIVKYAESADQRRLKRRHCVAPPTSTCSSSPVLPSPAAHGSANALHLATHTMPSMMLPPYWPIGIAPYLLPAPGGSISAPQQQQVLHVFWPPTVDFTAAAYGTPPMIPEPYPGPSQSFAPPSTSPPPPHGGAYPRE